MRQTKTNGNGVDPSPAELLIGRGVLRRPKPFRKLQIRETESFERSNDPAADPCEALRQFRALIEAREIVQTTLARDLAEERRRRERAETSEAQLRQALAVKDAMIDAMNGRASNAYEISTSMLSLPARTSPCPPGRNPALQGERSASRKRGAGH